MAHELTNSKIFDVNGSKYRVGIDGHGFVQIQRGRMWHNPATDEAEFCAYETDDEGIPPHVMFDPGTAGEIVDYIEHLLCGEQ